MFKVIFTDNSSKNIDLFIDGYLNSFIELFSDTGLVSEEEIKNDYILSSLKFEKDIYFSIRDLLSQETIFGYKILENGILGITIVVGNYRLFIEYFEDNKDKLRFVENIRFFYK